MPNGVALVAALDRHRVIGRNGTMPWHLPDDLRHFRRLTVGHSVVMGRRTFAALGHRPLPERHNIVLTRDPAYEAPVGVDVVHDRASAWQVAAADQELMVIGGAEVYSAFWDVATRLYLTRIEAAFEGDTFFPAWSGRGWRCQSQIPHPADERHPYAFVYERWERIPTEP